MFPGAFVAGTPNIKVTCGLPRRERQVAQKTTWGKIKSRAQDVGGMLMTGLRNVAMGLPVIWTELIAEDMQGVSEINPVSGLAFISGAGLAFQINLIPGRTYNIDEDHILGWLANQDTPKTKGFFTHYQFTGNQGDENKVLLQTRSPKKFAQRLRNPVQFVPGTCPASPATRYCSNSPDVQCPAGKVPDPESPRCYDIDMVTHECSAEKCCIDPPPPQGDQSAPQGGESFAQGGGRPAQQMLWEETGHG